MNLFQRAKEAIIKAEEIWNWCGTVWDDLKTGTPRQNVNQAPCEQATPTEQNSNQIRTYSPTSTNCQLNPEPCQRNTNDATQVIKYSIKWWKDRIEILGIFGGVAGVAVLIGQYWQMTKATGLTLDAVRVSQEQAIISRRQLDDSEGQQRAWLRIENVEVHRMTNFIRIVDTPFEHKTNYGVEIFMILKNFGSTPAVDISVSGFSIPADVERFENQMGITNFLPQKWHGETRIPAPGSGGISIMPQEIFTNSVQFKEFTCGENIYFEWWISYRTIFGQAGIIGQGGTYIYTNDAFAPAFAGWEKFKNQNQTNN